MKASAPRDMNGSTANIRREMGKMGGDRSRARPIERTVVISRLLGLLRPPSSPGPDDLARLARVVEEISRRSRRRTPHRLVQRRSV